MFSDVGTGVHAVVLASPGQVVMTRRPRPVCPAGGVLVRVHACGVCSADLRMVASGHRALAYPRILGHEISGTVAESRTKRFAVGDRVQVAPGLRCGRCLQCRRGDDQRCQQRAIIGFSVDGGFTEVLGVPLAGELRGALTRLPHHLAFDSATLAEPLACCINAQCRLAVGRADRVLIVGAGLLGLLHVVLARRRGAAAVRVVEPRADRRRLSVEIGADEALAPSRSADLEKGSVDVMIMACGPSVLTGTLSALLARGARINLFSGLPRGPAGLPEAAAIHYEEYSISGSYGCAAIHNRRAVALLADGAIPTARLITRHLRLDQLPSYLGDGPGPADLKTIVEP